MGSGAATRSAVRTPVMTLMTDMQAQARLDPHHRRRHLRRCRRRSLTRPSPLVSSAYAHASHALAATTLALHHRRWSYCSMSSISRRRRCSTSAPRPCRTRWRVGRRALTASFSPRGPRAAAQQRRPARQHRSSSRRRRMWWRGRRRCSHHPPPTTQPRTTHHPPPTTHRPPRTIHHRPPIAHPPTTHRLSLLQAMMEEAMTAAQEITTKASVATPSLPLL